MLFIPPQQLRRAARFALRPRRQRQDAWRPKCGRRLDANRIAKSQCYEPFPKSAIAAVGGIGQHHTARHILVNQRADLRKRDIRLGLEPDARPSARCSCAPSAT